MNHDAVSDFQTLENFFRIGDQRFQFRIRLLLTGELDEFDLIELVLPEDPPNILSIGPGFASETGRVGREFNRKPVAIDDVVPVDIRYRYLRCRNEVVIVIFELEKVLFELRKLAGCKEAFGVGDEGRQNLLISVFPGVDVEHEIDQRPLHASALTRQQWKPGTGNFGRPFQVENSQRRGQVPSRLWLEAQTGRGGQHAALSRLLHRRARWGRPG